MTLVFDETNKLTYNYRKVIKYIDNNIVNVPYINEICLNKILSEKRKTITFCKTYNIGNSFCSEQCEEYFKKNKCQSFIYAIKKNEPISNICNIFKNNEKLSHCSSECKNHFISK